MKVIDRIYKELKKEFKDIKKESITLEDNLIKSCELKFQNSGRLKAFPLSLGYTGENRLSGELIHIENLKGDILLSVKRLNNKILYIKEIEKHIYLKYLFKIKPKAVITNVDFGRKIYSTDFPILNVYSFLDNIKEIEINLDIQSKKYKSKNIFIDFGLGGNFIIILLPFDSRFQNYDSLDFYGSFKLFKYLLKRFKNFQSDIYRLRFLITDFKYTNYISLKEHIKNLEEVIAIYNIENSGLGNEKLIIKTDRYILDKILYKRIINIFNKKKKFISPAMSDELVNLPENYPIIWFNSQPNINLYKLDKNFVVDKFILDMSENIFDIIKNLYNEISLND
ncbi:MAG: hypothetical protein DSY66_02870 [Persephonella sp.]|nr:MAG: hypothetical protein DSY66_02870 [Persephonella sp.]